VTRFSCMSADRVGLHRCGHHISRSVAPRIRVAHRPNWLGGADGPQVVLSSPFGIVSAVERVPLFGRD